MRKLLMILMFSVFALGNEFVIKPHHVDVKLKCTDCHKQANEKDYKALDSNACLTCHGTKEKLAKRLDFLKGKNPHNSIHDNANLNCYTCHNEHKPSFNMCNTCHNTKTWMKEIK